MYQRYILGLTAAVFITASLYSSAESNSAAQYLSSYRWAEPEDMFGGFSGIEISDDGLQIVTVSDAGVIATGQIIREENQGTIIGVKDYELNPIRTIRGGPVLGIDDDAEGVALDSDGRIYVSFEGFHRIRRYDTKLAPATGISGHPDFAKMQNNSALEALAIDAQGRIYTLPERSGNLARPFPVYRWDGESWVQPFSIPRRGPYLPVGADFGPDGKLYLLERHLNGIFGFRTRIRRFTISDDQVTGEEQLLETTTGKHGNLEGIGVWTDASGALRVTMIGDDNFQSFLSTELVEYRIAE